MIAKELINFCAGRTQIGQRDLIEKDLVLHFILIGLSESLDFSERYALKGGTCLTKCHLGYFRFSEDLDFTYLPQENFNNKTNSQARRLISARLSSLISQLAEIIKGTGLRFQPDKNNKEYFEFGDGNRFTTLKIWYKSAETGMDTFIKIQINYMEHIEYKIIKKAANNLISGRGISDKEGFLLPEGSQWALKIPLVKCYGLEEILCEKIRAILTRRGAKSRDFIDIYLIEKKGRIKLENFEQQILRKIKSSLDNAKYLKNLENKKKALPEYEENEEARLLMIRLERDFYTAFLTRLSIFLRRLLLEL